MEVHNLSLMLQKSSAYKPTTTDLGLLSGRTRGSDMVKETARNVGKVLIPIAVTSAISFLGFFFYLKIIFPGVVADSKELKAKAAVCDTFQAVQKTEHENINTNMSELKTMVKGIAETQTQILLRLPRR